MTSVVRRFLIKQEKTMTKSTSFPHNSIFEQALRMSDGDSICITLEALDGTMTTVIGVNNYSHCRPHLRSKDGTSYPYENFFVREFH